MQLTLVSATLHICSCRFL